MSFRNAVSRTPHLGPAAYCAGLQALEATDRERIECENTHRLCGSVNIDHALEPNQPNQRRGDYAVCYTRATQIVYWIEVHEASQRGVAALEQKFDWLQGWLGGEGYRLRAFTAHYIWISSGETTFTKGSPQVRKLAQKGVRSVGRVLRIA